MYNVIDHGSRWYNTRELNQMGRMDQRTGVRVNIAPARPAGQPRLRYNWIAPIALSPHNPQIVYAGAQVLFRSLNRGDTWEEISPDLTTNDATKIGLNVPYCTITSISESPLKAGVIWVGTDDGKVQLTQNHGGGWTDLTPAWPRRALPIAGSTASSHRTIGHAFVQASFITATSERSFPLTDYGKTWTAIGQSAAPHQRRVQDRKPHHRRQRPASCRWMPARAGRRSRRTCRRSRCTT
jgi:hypothetical protein